MDTSITLLGDKTLSDLLIEAQKKSTIQHKGISQVKTPKGYVKKKMMFDYVEESYMRRRMDEEFPGWSFIILSNEIVGTMSLPKSMALKVHGRLKWFDNGIPREGDMIAAHRIQFKKKGDVITDEIVDMGNDFKSAVSDTLKKAINTYCNICDDVYKKSDPVLSEDQYEELLEIADFDLNLQEKIKNQIDNLQINQSNYDVSLRKLTQMRKKEKK